MSARPSFEMQQLTRIVRAQIMHTRYVRNVTGHPITGSFEEYANIHMDNLP